MKRLLIGVVAMFLFAGVEHSLASEWTYSEKIAAQNDCGNEYQDYEEFAACAIGVTLYGDGRRWSELSWTKQRAYDSCRSVCKGCSDNIGACRDGCRIARRND